MFSSVTVFNSKSFSGVKSFPISPDTGGGPVSYTHLYWLQRLGNIAEKEMFSVFNMGIGMILCVPPDVTDRILAACSTTDSPAFRLGEIRTQDNAEPTAVVA